MNRIIKPPKLHPGDVIGICAPASPPRKQDSIESGIRYLESAGFRIKMGKHIFFRRGYLAGTDVQRASDVNAMFADKSVKAIFTVRGGYGSQRILPLLDYRLIRRNPKILVGYSDITALQCALLAKIGLITFSGPFVSGEMSNKLQGHAEELFWSCLMSPQPPPPIKNVFRDRLISNKRKTAGGRLIGGNLSIISTLVGTPYFPSIPDPIYVLEDVGEQPYRIDRMLQHLHLAGVFSHARGIGLGNFTDCIPVPGKPSLTLQDVVRETFRSSQCPIVSGLPVGHIKNSIPFPIGVRAQLDGKKGTLRFLESGVR